MNNRDRAQLREILRHLDRGISYISKPDIAFCAKNRPATTTLHYTRESDGSTLYELDKQIGSDIAGLYFAKHILEGLLS